ncbi:MocR-like pyridoxine biosynthesis transcription factor PdxR [Xenorhabdus sp. KK7.4]|uniref:MocR-like pyridoxine biosynthesis transcription factor PdxR n=1 Tax=Xenorhabdus sp. KK7.4 TaxID=1851572 RepID=UPI000C04EEE2|nr:PLP-dependent aminotransferase family protein [Xenorhabdus sp. KK7.4]PHM59028.1 GntR family transcriptional regulator [Xenorhabdus sp. KK7.4]
MVRKSQSPFPHLLLNNGYIKDQVYHTIRNAILDGRLTERTKIPSTRALAEMMAISRNSVIAGFERLIDEGYLIARKGSGTYVSTTIPDELITTNPSPDYLKRKMISAPDLSATANRLMPFWEKIKLTSDQYPIFNIGVGCVDQFPHELWGQLSGRVWRHSKKTIGQFNRPDGYPLLKKVLADYVHSTRGVNCREDQIIIVNGTQQAINLAARVLLQPDDKVWLDDPGYDSARAIFTSMGAQIAPIPSDEQGMDIAYGAANHSDARLVYTSPSHQFPLGTTLALSRRLALLDWANQHNAWVFEDDYNSEFRYLSKPIQALQGLDTTQRVIYAGTFSKMLYPGLRIGFLVVPEALIDAFTMMKYYSDTLSGYLEQVVLAHFIQEGHYARHVRRVRKLCYERQTALFNAINRYLPHVFDVNITDSGIHMVCRLKDGFTEKEIITKCRQLGLGAQPLSHYCIHSFSDKAILFGYAAHTPAEINENIKRLADFFY